MSVCQINGIVEIKYVSSLSNKPKNEKLGTVLVSELLF